MKKEKKGIKHNQKVKKGEKEITLETVETLTDEQIVQNIILPQNMCLIGEKNDDENVIYIKQSVYECIKKFTANKTINESGGILLGEVLEEFGKINILVEEFIEAKYCEATPTTLTFTHKTWEYIHSVIDAKFSDKKIVGWIHTHPDFGIFLSEYDRFIHENFFAESYQIAYVVDPIRIAEGFFVWDQDKLEKTKGFYIYDDLGIDIVLGAKKQETDVSDENKVPIWKDMLLYAMCVFAVILLVCMIHMSNRINTLQNEQKAIINSANQSLQYLQQQIYNLQTEINNFSSETNINDELSNKVTEERLEEDSEDIISEDVSETVGVEEESIYITPDGSEAGEE